MWVQKLQRSKIIPIAMIVLLLVFTFEASRPQAVGLDTAVKIVAGSSAQKVVRSIGEKAGIAWSEKSLKATTDYINGQASRGNQKYIDLAKGVNTAAGAGTASATKPGWKKYALDPILWLTGADLLVEAYDAFNDAQTGDATVPMYGVETDYGGYCEAVDNGDGYIQFNIKHKESTHSVGAGRYGKHENPTCRVTYAGIDVSSQTIQVNVMVALNGKDWNGGWGQFPVPLQKYKDGYDYERHTSDDDEYDISNVTNADTFRTKIDNDDYSRVTYDNDIEIYAPDTDTTYNNDYTTPWNTKMPDDEFTLIVQPIQDVDIIVPPSDGDDLPTGERPDPVEVLDRSVLDVMVKSYKFFDDAIDATVVSMKSVVDGAGGIVTFLDESMDWLPSEWRAVFVSTFLLGVFAHFFRR